jgi:ATP-binding cassette, sub-family E, member 1
MDLLRHFAGKLCIEVNPGSKIAWISEELCIGCGICVKVRAKAWPKLVNVPISTNWWGLAVVQNRVTRGDLGWSLTWWQWTDPFLQKCPFEAIMIINLPKDLEKETTHRYGPNTFKLHRCGWLAG